MADIAAFEKFCERQAENSTDGTRAFRLNAVDACQHRAQADGLVIELGQDDVQRLMAQAFAKFPYLTDEAFYEAIQGHEALWEKRGKQAAQATWDAVQYALRSAGMKALPAQRERLADFSDQQLKDLIWSLRKAGAEQRLLQLLFELVGHGQ